MTDVRAMVEAKVSAHPGAATMTQHERELVVSALEGASSTVLDMLARVEALMQSSTTGMVAVSALRRAIAGPTAHEPAHDQPEARS